MSINRPQTPKLNLSQSKGSFFNRGHFVSIKIMLISILCCFIKLYCYIAYFFITLLKCFIPSHKVYFKSISLRIKVFLNFDKHSNVLYNTFIYSHCFLYFIYLFIRSYHQTDRGFLEVIFICSWLVIFLVTFLDINTEISATKNARTSNSSVFQIFQFLIKNLKYLAKKKIKQKIYHQI